MSSPDAIPTPEQVADRIAREQSAIADALLQRCIEQLDSTADFPAAVAITDRTHRATVGRVIGKLAAAGWEASEGSQRQLFIRPAARTAEGS